jgi:TPR repeat protein
MKSVKKVLTLILVIKIVLSILLNHPFWSGKWWIDAIIDIVLACIIFALDNKETKEAMEKEKKQEARKKEFEAREKEAEALYRDGVKYENGDGVQKDLEKALEFYEKSAALGNKKAMGSVGFFYQHGRGGVEKDEEKAFELYKKASHHLFLGLCYRDGIGTSKDDVAAAKEFQLAMQDGYPKGAYLYAKCRENGTGVEQDFQKAFCAYEEASYLGSMDARLELARCYMTGQGVEEDFTQALKLYTTVKIREPKLTEKCKKAIADIKRKSVERYFERLEANVPKDVDAMTLLRESIEQYNEAQYKDFVVKMEYSASLGEYRAQYAAGYLYENGIGVQKDEDIAFAWYKKAISSGHVVDTMPGYEFLCLRDQELAEEMLQLGCENSCSAALYYIGIAMLTGGNAQEANPEKGYILLTQAADKDNIQAMLRAADCCHRGIGTQKDESKAALWYQKAVESESPDAYYAYTVWRLETREPNSSKEKLTEILELLFEAVECNHPDSCYLWGCILDNGGVHEEAIDYFQVAAEHGHPEAMREMLSYYVDIKDNEKILYWVEKIAETGEQSAIRYAAQANIDNRNVEKASYWWEKLMVLGDPEAGEMLEWLDEMILLRREINRKLAANKRELKQIEENLERMEVEKKNRMREYDIAKRQRKLDNANTIGLLFGPEDEADYLAKHFKNEINRDRALYYEFVQMFPHAWQYLW